MTGGVNLWLFSDTLLGSGRLIHNSWAVESDGQFRFFSQELFRPPDRKGWFWVYAGLSYQGKTWVSLGQFEHQDGPEGYDFRFLRSWLSQIELQPGGRLQVKRYLSLPPQWASKAHFGAAWLEKDGYFYCYGTIDQGLSKQLVVARCSNPTQTDGWQFGDGRGSWGDISTLGAVTSNGKGRPLNVSNELSVWLEDGRFQLLYQEGTQIFRCSAVEPQGPFEHSQLCYQIQENAEGVFTYNAKVHPQYSDQSGWLVSYNRNVLPLTRLRQNGWLYRPQFLRVPRP